MKERSSFNFQAAANFGDKKNVSSYRKLLRQ